MARLPVVLIPPADLDLIFTALGILDKVDRGELSSEDAAIAPARAAYARGGTSFIRKHRRRPDGMHVATTHMVATATGAVAHRHGKDVVLGSIKFAADEPRR